MNFKPFYVKTETLNKSGVANIWQVAQDNGSRAYLNSIESALIHEYVGVDFDSYLLYSDDCEDFSCDIYDCEAVELTYEQAIAHMQSIPSSEPLEEPLPITQYNHNIVIQIELVGGSTKVKREVQEHEPTETDLEYFETAYGKSIYLDDFSSATVINTFKTKR